MDPRLGMFNTGLQPGFLRVQSGIVTVQAVAGMPWAMSAKVYLVSHQANGYFQYLAYRIKSGLVDRNYLNNPPLCTAPAP